MSQENFKSFEMSPGVMTSFFCDITAHLNDLNIQLQGKDQLIFQMFAAVKAFKMKFKLFRSQLSKGEMCPFPRVHSVSHSASTPN
jgi:hypothetical protein